VPRAWLKWLSLAVLVVAAIFVFVRSADPGTSVMMAAIFGGMDWLLGTERRRRGGG